MRCAVAVALLFVSAAFAQQDKWKSIEFLLGNWTGAGTGQPGAGSGKYSFKSELNGQIVVRRSYNLLATGTKHEDLLVMYADSRAMYWDSEGHVIEYRVTVPEPGRVIFDSVGAGPPYRLTYWSAGPELKGKFEVGGKTYLEWSSKKETP